MSLQYGEEQYERFLHWAIQGYKEFNLDMSRQVCTSECEVNSYRAIKLPENFLSLVTIGQECSDGIRTFAQDGRIPLNPQTRETEVCTTTTNAVQQLPLSGFGYWYSNYINRYGEDRGRLFGQVIKSNGTNYYRINYDKREIQLSPTLWSGKKVYIEYIASVVTVGKETLINPVVEALVGLYIEWMLVEHNDKGSANQKAWKKKLYDDEWDRCAARLSDFDPQDIKEYTMNGFYASPSI